MPKPQLPFPFLKSPSASRLLVLSAVLCLISSTAEAAVKNDLPRPDPFADPKHDPYNPLQYIANNTLTAIATALVFITGILQTWFIFKWGAKWMMSMTIGAYFFGLGIALRFGLHVHPQSKGIYIAEYLFVVLSPCAFIAADYVLLGRLAKHLDADKHLLVSSGRLTTVYVLSDVTTFLIQAIGGSMTTAANNPKGAKIGSRVFLGGLAAQLLSFATFAALYASFLYRVRKHEPRIWTMDDDKPWYKAWKTLAWALAASCIGILIRSGFRVAELSEGFRGHLATTEAYFYALDTLPLFIAIAVYIPFWPGRFIDDKPKVDSERTTPEEVHENNSNEKP